MAASTTASPRGLPAWEAGPGSGAARFRATLFAVLLSPGQFFRTLSIHGNPRVAERFGVIMLVPLILFDSKTVILHYLIMNHVGASPDWMHTMSVLLAIPLLVGPIWIFLYMAVVKLTWLESRYWGMRLPIAVVKRSLPYVSAHAAMISLLPLAVVSIFGVMLFTNDDMGNYLVPYLFTLSGAVVISAVYLFSIYWRAMRALMYANR